MAVRLLTFIAAVLVAVGCGGDDSQGDQPQKAGTVGGLTMYDVSSAAFRIGVPSDWDAVSADEALSGETIDEFLEDNPNFEPYRPLLKSPESPFKFFAFDPDVEDEFATNVNVSVLPVPESMTFAEYRQSSIAEAKHLAKGGRFEEEVVSLQAGQAQVLVFELDIDYGSDTRTISTLQYGFLRNGRSYVVAYTTLPRLDDAYADEFDRSVRSFRFL
jgi:hypothetical protein